MESLSIHEHRLNIKNKADIFLLNKLTSIKKYKQFEREETNGLLTYRCPSCNEIFGLSTKYLEMIGESSYLIPYSCPYCYGEYTIKD